MAQRVAIADLSDSEPVGSAITRVRADAAPFSGVRVEGIVDPAGGRLDRTRAGISGHDGSVILTNDEVATILAAGVGVAVSSTVIRPRFAHHRQRREPQRQANPFGRPCRWAAEPATR
ncbi:hypothetical protein [Nakamurella sp.]|uniref:hypothetical protein n=1 Tax=Nakamurella sp. TaxID=1869182 RepID=UPI003B3A8BD5